MLAHRGSCVSILVISFVLFSVHFESNFMIVISKIDWPFDLRETATKKRKSVRKGWIFDWIFENEIIEV